MHFARYLKAMTGHKFEHNELCGYYEDLKTMFSSELRSEAYALPTKDYTKDISIGEQCITMKFHFELPKVNAWQLLIVASVSTTVEDLWSIEASFDPYDEKHAGATLHRTKINSNSGIRSFNWVSELISKNYDYLRGIATGKLPDDYEQKVKEVQALFDEFLNKTKELGMNLYVDTTTKTTLPPVVLIVPDKFEPIPGFEYEGRKACLPTRNLLSIQNVGEIQKFDRFDYIFVDKNYTGK